MTRHIFAALILLSFLTSCDSKKSYKYVEVVNEEGLLGGTTTKEKDPKTISTLVLKFNFRISPSSGSGKRNSNSQPA